jgi:hypothetical protein
MKANELIIGNLIYRPCCTDKVVEIRSNGIIGCDKLRGLIPFSEIEPIKITEEWIVKNGFKKFFDDICEFSYYTKEVDGNYIDIKLDCSNIDENHVVCHVDNCDRCTIGCSDIQYVHQLQNFLNVLNIEMKVEL